MHLFRHLIALLLVAAGLLSADEDRRPEKEDAVPADPPRAVRDENRRIAIETDRLKAEVWPTGYVSGVKANTFVDKATGARDHSFGLDIVDFLLAPGAEGGLPYRFGGKVHGDIPKHYLELPQICTQAKDIPSEFVVGPDFVAVRQHWQWTKAAPGYEPGSRWEQTLVFPMGRRYFFSSDCVVSANDYKEVFLRTDLPGHLKHDRGDTFDQIYLSYEGRVPASEFFEDFPPDAKHFYQRGTHETPERMIRARKNHGEGKPWLAGMTLDPAIVSEAWCHQRGYICFIQEIGRLELRPGDRFAAAYIIGYFDTIKAMREEYDRYRGYNSVAATEDCWLLSDGVLVREGGPEAGLTSAPRFRVVPQGTQDPPDSWQVLVHGTGAVTVNGRRIEADGERVVNVSAGQ